MLFKTKRRLIIGISIILLLLLYAFKNYLFLAKVAGIIFGLWLFYFIDHAFHAHFHIRHYFYILAILILGILFSPFYWIYPNYDKILHLIMPILGSIMVFFLVDKLKIEFKWKLLLTFTTLIALLTVLEVGEFAMDKLWDIKAQGVYIRDISGLEKYNLVMDRNDDTMTDIILGMFGSTIFSIVKLGTYYYNKRYGGIKIKNL